VAEKCSHPLLAVATQNPGTTASILRCFPSFKFENPSFSMPFVPRAALTHFAISKIEVMERRGG
jgi:hypothetical protein